MSEKIENKSDKPSFFAKVGTGASKWMREMRSELKKVSWPSMQSVLNNTWIVIGCILVVGAFIWVFDFIAAKGVQALISAVRG